MEIAKICKNPEVFFSPNKLIKFVSPLCSVVFQPEKFLSNSNIWNRLFFSVTTDKTITPFEINQMQLISISGVGAKWSEVIKSGITLHCLKNIQTLKLLIIKAELD